MRRALFVALALLTTPVLAQAPGTRSAAAVVAGRYTADPNHTLVVWSLDHLGFTPYTGIFGDITGTLEIDPASRTAARVDISIPVSKVVTASAALNQHLLRPGKDGGKPDFFGPTPADARFVSTRVVTSGDTAKVTGDFTFNGVTRPVTLDVQFYGAGKLPAAMGGKDNVGFHVTGAIKRSDFGLDFFVPMLGDVVKLDIAAAFQK